MPRPDPGRRASLRPYVAVCVLICLVATGSLVVSYVSPTLATSRAVPSINSTPSAGPVGTVVAVSGSGWSASPDGAPVTFGFFNGSGCNIVQDAQPGTLDEGSFSGWFRWPTSSGLGPFTVCAVIGTNSRPIPVNFFNVLSSTPPQLSLSTASLSAGKSVTVSGANYLPAGSPVQLHLQPVNGGSSISLASVMSDNNGAFTSTFTVPANTQPGAYMLTASVSSGNMGLPPTLSASASFHVNTPALPPMTTPTPNPTPTPGATATPVVTATPAATPTAIKTTSTPGAAQTPVTSHPAQGNQVGQTPGTRSGGSPSGNTGGFTSSKTLFTTAGIAGLLVGSAGLGMALLVRRRRRAQGAGRAQPATAQAGTLYPAGADFSWQQDSFAAQTPGYPPLYPGQPSINNQSNQPMQPLAQWATTPLADASDALMLPEPVLSGARPAGGMTNGAARPGSETLSMQPPAQLAYQQPQAATVADAVDSADYRAGLIQSDPALEAVMRQAQAGLFATPRKV